MIRGVPEEARVPDGLTVPGSVLQTLSPIPFPLLDGHGADVAAHLADPARAVALQAVMVTIPEARVPDFRAHLHRRLLYTAGDQSVPDHARAWMLRCALQFEVETMFSRTQPARATRDLLDVTRCFAREGASWSPGSTPLYRQPQLVGATYSPVTHAVNAALYATSLAAAAGEDRQEVLQGVTLAAVFADVGIDEVSDRARIERALAFLRRARVGSVAAMVGVLGRRARWDGGGPPGIAGSAIPFEARCTAIACDYDLRTLGGDHFTALSPIDALTQMVQSSGVYDPALLRIFIRGIGGVTAEDDAGAVVRGGVSKHPERVREMLRALRVA